MTNVLREELLELDLDPAWLINEFIGWKRLGLSGEDSNYYFGKDAEYSTPTIDRRRVLRHAHLAPLNDAGTLATWDRAWNRGSKRVSDTALVYADGGHYGHLLLTILWTPTAHSTARMDTEEARELMLDLAATADQFIFNGTCEA